MQMIHCKLQLIFSMQAARRRVCEAAEPEVTKTRVNIYEAFSHQILDNWRLQKDKVGFFFLFEKNSIHSGENKQKVSVLEQEQGAVFAHHTQCSIWFFFLFFKACIPSCPHPANSTSAASSLLRPAQLRSLLIPLILSSQCHSSPSRHPG